MKTNSAERVMADYREMPGLSVTLAQGARLWGLSLIECESVLAMLVADGQLFRDHRGLFLRRGAVHRRSHSVKAPLERAADRSASGAKARRR